MPPTSNRNILISRTKSDRRLRSLRDGFQSQLSAPPAAGLSESVGCTQRKFGVSRRKVFAGFKGGHLRCGLQADGTCGAAGRLTPYFGHTACGGAFRVSWAHTPNAWRQLPKSFCGIERGLFSKSPLLRAPAAGNRVSMFAAGMFVWHFLFADKGYCPLSIFFCAGAPGKPKPHGALQFFASRKTEWFRLTGRSLKEKAGVKSDNGMERVTLRPPTPHPPLRGPPSPTGEGEREPFFRKGHSICPRFRQNLTSVGEGSPLPFVGHYALHAGDQWSPLQQGWSPSESPHPTLTQSVNRGGA